MRIGRYALLLMVYRRLRARGWTARRLAHTLRNYVRAVRGTPMKK